MPTAQTQTQLAFEQLQKRKEYLVALILLFVIVIVWIGVSVFSSQQQLGISPADKKLAQPIKPTLNVSVLDSIEQKRLYSGAELADFPVFAQAEDEQGQKFLIDVRDLEKLSSEGSQNTTPSGGSQGEQVPDATESGASQRQDVTF